MISNMHCHRVVLDHEGMQHIRGRLSIQPVSMRPQNPARSALEPASSRRSPGAAPGASSGFSISMGGGAETNAARKNLPYSAKDSTEHISCKYHFSVCGKTRASTCWQPCTQRAGPRASQWSSVLHYASCWQRLLYKGVAQQLRTVVFTVVLYCGQGLVMMYVARAAVQGSPDADDPSPAAMDFFASATAVVHSFFSCAVAPKARA